MIAEIPICADCKQVITQKKYAILHGKYCHMDFDQCFRALNKRIRELESALQPFAEDAKDIDKGWSDNRLRHTLNHPVITVGHLRKAANVIGKPV